MYGGNEPEVQVADEEELFDERREQESEQSGGRKNFAILKKNAEKKKLSIEGKVPSDKAVLNSIRSFTAVVNGRPLGEKRYFHGEPRAAARKVISMINKEIVEHKVDGAHPRQVAAKPVEFSTIGKTNAVHIKLTEVTKGVLKSTKVLGADGKMHREHYTYEYFGWRVPSEKSFTRGGNEITTAFKNVVIPARGGASLAAAEQAAAALAARPAVAAARKQLANLAASKRRL
jgi:hypothetical protein